jgi:hypothetical protein
MPHEQIHIDASKAELLIKTSNGESLKRDYDV